MPIPPIASRAPLIKLPDAHLKLKCNVLFLILIIIIIWRSRVPSGSDLSLLWAQAIQESFQTEISLQEQEEVQEPPEEDDSFQGPQQTLQVQVRASVWDIPSGFLWVRCVYVCFWCRDRRKEDKIRKRSKTPPKSYSSARRSRSSSRWVSRFTPNFYCFFCKGDLLWKICELKK